MKRTRKYLALLCLVLVASLFFSACGGDKTETPQTKPSGSQSSEPGAKETEGNGAEDDVVRLNVGLSSAPVSLNTWSNNDRNSSLIASIAMPSLVKIDDNGKKVGVYGTTWSSNDDATQFTVTLPSGLVWSDGEPFDSSDMKFTAEYLVEKEFGYNASMFTNVESVETPDELTVVYNLKSPDVNFFNQAGFWVSPLPEQEFADVDDPMNHNYSGVGYGPFYIAEESQGEYVLLKKNPHYTLTDVAIDEIVFRVYTDENTMVLALQNGEIDCTADYVSVASQSQLSTNPDMEFLSTQSLGYGFSSFSQSNELLRDVNVRMALSMGYDRDAICQVAYQGGAVPMETPVSPVWKDFAASGIKQPSFDIEAGAQLLEESGYVDSDGDGVRENADGEKLAFELIYRAGLAAADSVVEIVRSNLAKMGVEVTLVPTDAATFSAKVTQGHEYDISYSVWGVIDDVDTALHIIYGMNETLNFMDYNDQEMEDLLLQSRQTVEYEERVKIIDEWQKLFVERMPTVNLFVATNTYAVNTSNFSGYTLSPGNNGVFDAVNVVKITPNN